MCPMLVEKGRRPPGHGAEPSSAYGHGATPMGPHFGIEPILEPICVEIGISLGVRGFDGHICNGEAHRTSPEHWGAPDSNQKAMAGRRKKTSTNNQATEQPSKQQANQQTDRRTDGQANKQPTNIPAAAFPKLITGSIKVNVLRASQSYF